MQKLRFILSILWLSFGLALSSSAWADVQEIPPLTQRVTDTTGMLNSEQQGHLEQILSDLEKTKGSQVAVLIVATTAPEDIADYSMRAVEAWKLGRKDVDDGVLLLIAQDDRRMRIEVGYGLEGSITDLSAGRIIREYMTPEFRRGRFYEGTLAGTAQIINLIKGEPLPAPSSSQGDISGTDPGFIFFILVAGSSFLGSFLTPLLGRLITVSILTVAGSGIVWLVSHNIFMVALAVLFIGLFTLSATSSRSSSYRDGGGYGGGFGGGGGGGFSGGGGGFGGGGASGGW